MKTVANENRTRILDMLRAAGYCRLWAQDIKGTKSEIMAFSGARGLLLVQVWEDSVSIYSDVAPKVWDELPQWLSESV